MAEIRDQKLKDPSDITPDIREKLEERWGDEWTDEEYIALERNYRNLASDNTDIFSDVAMHLRDISEWMMRRKKAIQQGDTKMVTSLNASIKQSFAMIKDAREQKEQKAIAKRTVDGFVRRLEEKGMMKDGVMLLAGVVDYIQNDHGTYYMSKDVADGMMMSIVNAMRYNNGVSELVELPEELRVQDLLGEFVEEPTYGEKQMLFELGLNVSQKKPGES